MPEPCMFRGIRLVVMDDMPPNQVYFIRAEPPEDPAMLRLWLYLMVLGKGACLLDNIGEATDG